MDFLMKIAFKSYKKVIKKKKDFLKLFDLTWIIKSINMGISYQIKLKITKLVN